MKQELPKLNLIVANSGAQVALMDSKYMLVVRGVGLKNKLSKAGITKSVAWPSLRNVQTDKVGACVHARHGCLCPTNTCLLWATPRPAAQMRWPTSHSLDVDMRLADESVSWG